MATQEDVCGDHDVEAEEDGGMQETSSAVAVVADACFEQGEKEMERWERIMETERTPERDRNTRRVVLAAGGTPPSRRSLPMQQEEPCSPPQQECKTAPRGEMDRREDVVTRGLAAGKPVVQVGGEEEEGEGEEEGEEEEVCMICWEPYSSSGRKQICCLQCGHLFCKSCITTWLHPAKQVCGAVCKGHCCRIPRVESPCPQVCTVVFLCAPLCSASVQSASTKRRQQTFDSCTWIGFRWWIGLA